MGRCDQQPGAGVWCFAGSTRGAGVIANQSLPDISAGNAGIELLAQGTPAGAVLDRMIDIDSTDGMLLEPIQAALRDQFGIEMEALRDIRR